MSTLTTAKAQWPTDGRSCAGQRSVVGCDKYGQVSLSIGSQQRLECSLRGASLSLDGNRKSNSNIAPLASSDLQRSRTAQRKNNHPRVPRGGVGAREAWLCITKKTMSKGGQWTGTEGQTTATPGSLFTLPTMPHWERICLHRSCRCFGGAPRGLSSLVPWFCMLR